ncbi:FAD-dependent oxidoreductase [Comamonadaceae bacterium M7527]|nr:FAD-dependent oxidoreductase [Comamonadaceae bacterium M7527]
MHQHAIVIGAGLAGSATAHALAKRGWRVTLIEQHAAPARGASALPVGMLSPHHTQSPTPMSRLCALGLQATQAQLQRVLPTQHGWQPTQVRNYKASISGEAITPHFEEAAHLVSPVALVHAWLGAYPDLLQVLCNRRVHQLQRCPDTQHWQAIDTDGQTIAKAPVAVVCNAFAANELLNPHVALGLRAVAGQMTWGLAKTTPQAAPTLRYKGVYAPCFLTHTGETVWSMGATYRRGESQPCTLEQDQLANRSSLSKLAAANSQAASALARFDEQQAAGTLRNWVGVRCASTDRLPLCGALPAAAGMAQLHHSTKLLEVETEPGLYGLLALGSRGLSLAALLGDVLASQITGQPQDAPQHLPADLLRAIDPRRAPLQVMRQLRRQTHKAKAAQPAPVP